MRYLLKLNWEAAKNINYYKLENNFIIKFFLKHYSTYAILNLMMKVIINLEKKLILPFFVLKLGIIFSYLLGSFLRKHINMRKKLLNNSWYV